MYRPGLKGPTGTFFSYFFLILELFPLFILIYKKNEISNNNEIPDLPTDVFFFPPGSQETIFYLRVALAIPIHDNRWWGGLTV